MLSEEEGLVLRAVEAFNDTEEVRTDGREQEERNLVLTQRIGPALYLDQFNLLVK